MPDFEVCPVGTMAELARLREALTLMLDCTSGGQLGAGDGATYYLLPPTTYAISRARAALGDQP